MAELLRKLVKVIVTSAVQHSSDFLPAEHFSPRRRRQQYFLPIPSVRVAYHHCNSFSSTLCTTQFFLLGNYSYSLVPASIKLHIVLNYHSNFVIINNLSVYIKHDQFFNILIYILNSCFFKELRKIILEAYRTGMRGCCTSYPLYLPSKVVQQHALTLRL